MQKLHSMGNGLSNHCNRKGKKHGSINTLPSRSFTASALPYEDLWYCSTRTVLPHRHGERRRQAMSCHLLLSNQDDRVILIHWHVTVVHHCKASGRLYLPRPPRNHSVERDRYSIVRTYTFTFGAEFIERLDLKPRPFRAVDIERDSHGIFFQEGRETFIHGDVFITLDVQQLNDCITVLDDRSRLFAAFFFILTFFRIGREL